MDPVSTLISEMKEHIHGARTRVNRATVAAVNGGEVRLQIGADPTPMAARWLGPAVPRVGDVVTYIDDGSPYPLVLGPTGTNPLGLIADWTPYNPTWNADSGTPVLGGGILTGRYLKGNAWVLAEIHLWAQSDTTFGAGPMRFGLPLAAASSVDPSYFHQIGGHVYDAGVGWFPLTCLVQGTTATPMYHSTAVASYVTFNYLTASAPISITPGDAIHLVGVYRTA